MYSEYVALTSLVPPARILYLGLSTLWRRPDSPFSDTLTLRHSRGHPFMAR
jgi:hypothetical protein